MIEDELTLDVSSARVQGILNAKYGDTARAIRFCFRRNGEAWNPGENARVILTARKADSKFLYNDCVYDRDAFVYVFTPQTTSCPGLVRCELRIYIDDKLAVSPRFDIEVIDTVFHEGDKLDSTSEATALKSIADSMDALLRSVEERLQNGEFMGEKGDPGEKGERGEKGEKGEKGDPGKDGVVAVSGAARGDAAVAKALDENGTPTQWEPWPLVDSVSMDTKNSLQIHYPDGSAYTVPMPTDKALTDEYLPANAKAVGDALGLKLDSSDLPNAVDAALAQAKAGGEFDGAPGEKGEPGTTPHIGENGNWYLGSADTGVDAGGGEKWELLNRFSIAEADACRVVAISQDSNGQPFHCKKLCLRTRTSAPEATKSTNFNGWICTNGSGSYNSGVMGCQTSYLNYAAYYRIENCFLYQLSACGYQIFNASAVKCLATAETELHEIELAGYGDENNVFFGEFELWGVRV